MLFFPPNSNLRGILRYFSKNPKLYKAEVTTKESSHYVHQNNWGHGDVILDQKNTEKNSDCWCSANKPNQYIDINFKIHYVKATSFSIKPLFSNEYIIHKFVLQGSNSSDNFVNIYTHDGTYLKYGVPNVFNCQKNETYNHFRILMLDKVADLDEWHLIICAVEFFGYVTDLSLYPTCYQQRYHSINNLIFFITLGLT